MFNDFYRMGFGSDKSIEIFRLISEMLEESKKIDELEKSLYEDLNANDIVAKTSFEEAIKLAGQKYNKIGVELNSIGSYNLMQYALNIVPNNRGNHSVISSYWDGIGDWIH